MDRIIDSTKRVFMKFDDRFKATDGVTGTVTGVPSLDPREASPSQQHRRRFYFDPLTGTFTLVDQAQAQQPAH